MGYGFLFIILVYVIVNLINNKLAASEKKIITNQVHLPKIYLWVGVLDSTVFSSFILIANIFPQISTNFTWFAASVFSLFILLGLVLIAMYFNCKIDLGEDKFTYHTFLGKEYTFCYTDIRRIRRTQNTIHMYTQRKHLYVDKHAEGWEEFIRKIK